MADKGKLSGQEATAAFLIWANQHRTNQLIAEQTRQLSTAQRYIHLHDGNGERSVINVRGDSGGDPSGWIQADLDGRWYEWRNLQGAYVYTDGRPPPPAEERWRDAILTIVVVTIFSAGIALLLMPVFAIYLLAKDDPAKKTATLCLAVPIGLVLTLLLLVAIIQSSQG